MVAMGMIDGKTGRKLISTDEAAAIYDCDASVIRKLRIEGELHAIVHSPHRIFFFEDEVRELSAAKAEVRRKRGGRPRSSQERKSG
jgi:hypothetical protein